MRQQRVTFGLMAFFLVFWSTVRFGVAPVEAARSSDVRSTKHNLSASGTGTVHANSTQTNAKTDASQVCVFCHTPHGAQEKDQGGGTLTRAPLWNRKVPDGSTYTAYTSSTLDAQSITDGFNNQPGGSSKLCLSCHDGTLAIGSVGVLGGKQNVAIDMVGTNAGVMPSGSYGNTSGFTRNLGNNLTNDHPISVTYNSALVTADGEMRGVDANQRSSGGANATLPTGITHAVGIRNSPSGTRPLLPLEKTGGTSVNGATLGQVQCASCHNPHIKDDAADHNIKFLRANRFQVSTPAGGTYDANNDIICLACHDKGGTAWSASVHATATLTYKNSGTPNPIAVRDFPSRATFKVWEAACLNCHDTHTVPGARRLLREGTDDGNNPKTGGNSAIEETCFQCHRAYTDSANILNLTSQSVPDIKSDFDLTYHMPIRGSEQCAGTEKHNIGDAIVEAARQLRGKDFFEDPVLLGRGNAGTCDVNSNRHVECTDCHNPHRAIKNSLAAGGGLTTQSTHQHTAGVAHSNAASGALKGAYGVEPVYGGSTFGSLPSSYTALCGIAEDANNACSSPVTKEYQICLKCHSDYAYNDTGSHNDPGRPPLALKTDAARTTTKIGTSNADAWWPGSQWNSSATGATHYTNQAMEFQAPTGDTSEYNGGGVQAVCYDTSPDTTCNHRSWHPVIGPTGRTAAIRGSTATNWRGPFSAAVGTQTMYCTDCHGSDTASGTVVPNANKPWGPHGSANRFILKGVWTTSTGTGNSGDLCFKCHEYNIYTAADGNGGTTGFKMGTRSNKSPGSDGHKVHRDKINGGTPSSNNTLRCNWCHVAVPHGWKNKAFLVNLNDVGPEVGLAAGTAKNGPYTQGPYYRNAMLKVSRFATSGNWADADCNGGADNMKNTCKTPP